jgi:predicted nucleotidyltransferase
MKVKSQFLNTFDENVKKELLEEIANFKIPLASRDRAIRMDWNGYQQKSQPLYITLGYNNAQDFITKFQNGEIETKTEV